MNTTNGNLRKRKRDLRYDIAHTIPDGNCFFACLVLHQKLYDTGKYTLQDIRQILTAQLRGDYLDSVHGTIAPDQEGYIAQRGDFNAQITELGQDGRWNNDAMDIIVQSTVERSRFKLKVVVLEEVDLPNYPFEFNRERIYVLRSNNPPHYDWIRPPSSQPSKRHESNFGCEEFKFDYEEFLWKFAKKNLEQGCLFRRDDTLRHIVSQIIKHADRFNLVDGFNFKSVLMKGKMQSGKSPYYLLKGVCQMMKYGFDIYICIPNRNAELLALKVLASILLDILEEDDCPWKSNCPIVVPGDKLDPLEWKRDYFQTETMYLSSYKGNRNNYENPEPKLFIFRYNEKLDGEEFADICRKRTALGKKHVLMIDECDTRPSDSDLDEWLTRDFKKGAQWTLYSSGTTIETMAENEKWTKENTAVIDPPPRYFDVIRYGILKYLKESSSNLLQTKKKRAQTEGGLEKEILNIVKEILFNSEDTFFDMETMERVPHYENERILSDPEFELPPKIIMIRHEISNTLLKEFAKEIAKGINDPGTLVVVYRGNGFFHSSERRIVMKNGKKNVNVMHPSQLYEWIRNDNTFRNCVIIAGKMSERAISYSYHFTLLRKVWHISHLIFMPKGKQMWALATQILNRGSFTAGDDRYIRNPVIYADENVLCNIKIGHNNEDTMFNELESSNKNCSEVLKEAYTEEDKMNHANEQFREKRNRSKIVYNTPIVPRHTWEIWENYVNGSDRSNVGRLFKYLAEEYLKKKKEFFPNEELDKILTDCEIRAEYWENNKHCFKEFLEFISSPNPGAKLTDEVKRFFQMKNDRVYQCKNGNKCSCAFQSYVKELTSDKTYVLGTYVERSQTMFYKERDKVRDPDLRRHFKESCMITNEAEIDTTRFYMRKKKKDGGKNARVLIAVFKD